MDGCGKKPVIKRVKALFSLGGGVWHRQRAVHARSGDLISRRNCRRAPTGIAYSIHVEETVIATVHADEETVSGCWVIVIDALGCVTATTLCGDLPEGRHDDRAGSQDRSFLNHEAGRSNIPAAEEVNPNIYGVGIHPECVVIGEAPRVRVWSRSYEVVLELKEGETRRTCDMRARTHR
jgi:hypothetical protein